MKQKNPGDISKMLKQLFCFDLITSKIQFMITFFPSSFRANYFKLDFFR